MSYNEKDMQILNHANLLTGENIKLKPLITMNVTYATGDTCPKYMLIVHTPLYGPEALHNFVYGVYETRQEADEQAIKYLEGQSQWGRYITMHEVGGDCNSTRSVEEIEANTSLPLMTYRKEGTRNE